MKIITNTILEQREKGIAKKRTCLDRADNMMASPFLLCVTINAYVNICKHNLFTITS